MWIDGRDSELLGGPVTADRNKVQGNFIGTDPSGMQDLGKGIDGISVYEARDTIVGGTTRAARNVISANESAGVRIAEGSTSNDVQGNLIGTTASGAGDVGNVPTGQKITATATGAEGTSEFSAPEGVK